MSALINALRLSLVGELGLRKSRLESFCVMILGVLSARTVNLSHLAGYFPGPAALASNYRRLQRFFEQVRLDHDVLARIIVRAAGLGHGPWLLAMDRTNWKLGRCEINILMLAIVGRGIAVPVMWQVMGRAGNSTTAQRTALIDRFCNTFGADAIAGLVADREFVGKKWFNHLAAKAIPFVLRIKQDFHLHLPDGRHTTVEVLFRKLAKTKRRYLHGPIRLGQALEPDTPAVNLAATRLASGELLVVATNTKPKAALADYRRRWTIETMFGATKTRGFNLEDTHLTDPPRIAMLLAVVALAFAIAHAAGHWRDTHRPISRKTHGRPAQSIFRYGCDLLRAAVLHHPGTAAKLCQTLIAGRPPNQSPRSYVYSYLQP